MGDGTKIEWTNPPGRKGATWNPITGCSVISPGCTNCYAMDLAGTRLKNHISRKGLTRKAKSGAHVWNGEVRFNEQWLDEPLRWKKPRMIFVCAHGDLFHESVPDEWIDRVFAVMALRPQHVFQVLTKRAERMRDYVSGHDLYSRLLHHAYGFRVARPKLKDVPISDPGKFPAPHIWLGVSAEDQPRADERIPLLLETPAAVRWVSAEPLLGTIDLSKYLRSGQRGIHFSMSVDGALRQRAFDGLEMDDGTPMPPEMAELRLRELQANGVKLIGQADCKGFDPETGCPGHPTGPVVNWVVAGGESGRRARQCQVEWLRSLRGQCEEARAPLFMKQFGARPTLETVELDEWPDHVRFTCDGPGTGMARVLLSNSKGAAPAEWPEDLRVREWPV